jgi:hypothetical protein
MCVFFLEFGRTWHQELMEVPRLGETPLSGSSNHRGKPPRHDWPRAYKPHRKITFASWQGKTNRLDVNGTRTSWSVCVAPHSRRDRRAREKKFLVYLSQIFIRFFHDRFNDISILYKESNIHQCTTLRKMYASAMYYITLTNAICCIKCYLKFRWFFRLLEHILSFFQNL